MITRRKQLTLALLMTGMLLTGMMPMVASACDRTYRQSPIQHSVSNPKNVSKHSHVRYVVYLKTAPSASEQHHAPSPSPAPPVSPLSVDAGASYRMTGRPFGLNLGSVILEMGGVEIQCDVQTWSPDEVTFQMPLLRLRRPTPATLNIVVPSGETVVTKAVLLRGLQIQVAEPTLEPIFDFNDGLDAL